MQLAVFGPVHAGHLRHLAVDFQALGLEFFLAGAGQLERQLPGKKAQAFSFGFKGFIQTFLTILLHRLAHRTGGQWIQCFEFCGQFRVFAKKAIKGLPVIGAGFSHNDLHVMKQVSRYAECGCR